VIPTVQDIGTASGWSCITRAADAVLQTRKLQLVRNAVRLSLLALHGELGHCGNAMVRLRKEKHFCLQVTKCASNETQVR
jgi:hypothetical protein